MKPNMEQYENLYEAWEDIETLKSFVIQIKKGLRNSRLLETTHMNYPGGTRTLGQMLDYMKEDLDLVLVKLDGYLND